MNNPALFLCLTVIRLTTGKAETLQDLFAGDSVMVAVQL